MSSLDLPPDPHDPGIGGGFDHVSYFTNRFLPRLEDCTSDVEQVFNAWARGHELAIPVREVAPGNLLIHATRDGLGGMFEITYRVDAKRERARVTVYFYSRDGARHSLVAIREMLEQWKVAGLQTSLGKALSCQTG